MFEARDAIERPDHEPAGVSTNRPEVDRPIDSSEVTESRRRSVRIVVREEDDWPASRAG